MKAMGQKGPCLCLVHFVKTCFWQTCCGHILLARNLLLSKPCHHLINLTSDSPGARSVTPSLPRTPNFNVGADVLFFCLVSPLSTLRFGGAGGNGAHHTSEVKIITGWTKWRWHMQFIEQVDNILLMPRAYLFLSRRIHLLCFPLTTSCRDNIFSMLRRYLFLSHRIHLICVSSAFE